jgi:hypothetical protein
MTKLITAVALLLVGTQITWAQRGGAPDFEALDTDESGALDLEEVTAMFAAFGGRGGQAPDPAEIFAAWDADGNDSISKEEFDSRPRMGGGMSGGMGG